MAKRQRSADESAREARAIAVVCAIGVLGAAAWVVWRHAVGAMALDPERGLTLAGYLVFHAVSLFAVAQPPKFFTRPLNLRLGLQVVGGASVNVCAAAFFVIDLALVWSAVTERGPHAWILLFLLPIGASLWLLIAGRGATPEETADVSDEDLTEAALILTESQRRWSWRPILAMAAFMSATRPVILAAYYASLIVGTTVYEWLYKAFFETRSLTGQDLDAAGAGALAFAAELVSRPWLWFIFFVVAVLPPLFMLSTAVWYRMRQRRERARFRSISRSSAARLMTEREVRLLRRAVDRPLATHAIAQRGVS
jgi:hypothetical protein